MRPDFQEPCGPKRLSFNNIKLTSCSAGLIFDAEKGWRERPPQRAPVSACPGLSGKVYFLCFQPVNRSRSRTMSKLSAGRLVLASAFLLCAFEAGIAQSNDANRQLSRAVELYQAGDIEGAIREYKAFLAVYPNVM